MKKTAFVMIIIIMVVFNSNFVIGGMSNEKENVTVKSEKGTVYVSNNTQLIYCELSKGKLDLMYGKSKILSGVESSVKVDAKNFSTGNASKHEILKERSGSVNDSVGKGVRVAVDNVCGDIHIVQLLSVYENKSYIILKTEVYKNKGDISTNHIAPVVMKAPKGNFCHIDIGKAKDPRVLFVPFDNDKWVKFEANSYVMAHKSYEVTAIYDSAGRQGLVMGSLDHDIWKTAIDIKGEKEGLTYLEVYGGAADFETRDTLPHGTVSGKKVASPEIFIGMFKDYRTGLEQYGKANAALVKPLEWEGGSIYGWNSWYAASSHIDATTYLNAADFIKEKLQPEGFLGSNDTVYINFDSFWDNLSEQELKAAVKHVHEQGQKAGIYWTPFVYWGSNPSQPVEGGDGATYGDILLNDIKGNHLPPLAGGYPIDPTNPAQIKRMEYQVAKFVEWGFDFIKLDFLTHGAMEGVHYNKNITTGIQAYNFGMNKLQELLSKKKTGRSIFISASIAPIFPYQYANARRISCDVFNELKDSEYMLNSLTYGWWQKEFYHSLDGDMMSLYKREGGVSSRPEEALMRVNSAAVTGGLFLAGDNYNFAALYKKASGNLSGTQDALKRSEELLSNKIIQTLINNNKPFLPLEGNIRNDACDTFILNGSNCSYIAIFNYNRYTAKTFDISMERAGLDKKKIYDVTDIWSGKDFKFSGSLHTKLLPGGSTIFKLK